jgi:hypothetical protein
MAQLALNRFKTETIVLTTSDQTIYTAPTGYTGIVLYAHVTNVASSAVTFTMSHVRSATTTEIIKDASVPVSDAYVPLDGKLVLQTNDSVKASAGANSSLKVLLSVLETAN